MLNMSNLRKARTKQLTASLYEANGIILTSWSSRKRIRTLISMNLLLYKCQ